MRSESVICKIAYGLYFWILGNVCMRNSRQTNFRDAYFYENTRKYKSKDNGTGSATLMNKEAKKKWKRCKDKQQEWDRSKNIVMFIAE